MLEPTTGSHSHHQTGQLIPRQNSIFKTPHKSTIGILRKAIFPGRHISHPERLPSPPSGILLLPGTIRAAHNCHIHPSQRERVPTVKSVCRRSTCRTARSKISRDQCTSCGVCKHQNKYSCNTYHTIDPLSPFCKGSTCAQQLNCCPHIYTINQSFSYQDRKSQQAK